MSERLASNWTAVFQNAAGNTVFTAAGHESEMTMDIKTGETFLFKALVQMEEKDIATQSFGCDVEPVSDTWSKAVINAVPFGITDFEVDKANVSEDFVNDAQRTAYLNMQAQPQNGLF